MRDDKSFGYLEQGKFMKKYFINEIEIFVFK